MSVIPEVSHLGFIGSASCLVQEDPEAPPCWQPAAWHVRWTRRQGEGSVCSLVCNKHMKRVKAAYAFYDRHPVGEHCSGPRVRWREERCEPQ